MLNVPTVEIWNSVLNPNLFEMLLIIVYVMFVAWTWEFLFLIIINSFMQPLATPLSQIHHHPKWIDTQGVARGAKVELRATMWFNSFLIEPNLLTDLVTRWLSLSLSLSLSLFLSLSLRVSKIDQLGLPVAKGKFYLQHGESTSPVLSTFIYHSLFNT